MRDLDTVAECRVMGGGLRGVRLLAKRGYIVVMRGTLLACGTALPVNSESRVFTFV